MTSLYKYYPVYLDLRDQSVLIIGGNHQAESKVDRLCHSKASSIYCINSKLSDKLLALKEEGVINCIEREPVEEDIKKADLIIVTEDSKHLYDQVFSWAKKNQKLVNCLDRTDCCNFIAPAIASSGCMQVAVSSGGASPALATLIKEKIQKILDPSFGQFAEVLNDWRPKVKATISTFEERKRFWEKIVRGPAFSAIRDGNINAAHEEIKSSLENRNNEQHDLSKGTVYFVGAGPGDPGLLTVRAVELLKCADVVLYDELVNEEIISRYVNVSAELVNVGMKRYENGEERHSAILRLMKEYSTKYKNIVRLKGGDIFVFSRGGEEYRFLSKFGIPVEVVPGVSSVTGVPSSACIPLTDYEYSSSFSVFTGVHRNSEQQINWELASKSETAVFLMSVRVLDSIVERLIQEGKDPKTPIAILMNGTRKNKKHIITTLQDVLNNNYDVSSPAVIVVGKTVTSVVN